MEKKNSNCAVVKFVSLLSRREGGQLILQMAMYAGKYNLNAICLVAECFQKLLSNLVLVYMVARLLCQCILYTLFFLAQGQVKLTKPHSQ